MEVASPQLPGANGVASPTADPSIDSNGVLDHVAQACQIALGATSEDLQSPGSLLHKHRYSDTLQRCTRFATDSLIALYIQKDILPASTIQNGAEDLSSFNPPSNTLFGEYPR